MRVLFVGTLPPPGGASALEFATAAAKRQAEGDEVELLSADPASAVHRVRRLDGLFLSLELAWLSRRYDALELRIEDGLPCGRDLGRGARAAILAALGAAVSRYSEVTLRLDSPVPIPGGVGGRASRRLWAAAGRIIVQSSSDRDELVVAPGVDPAHVVVEPPAASSHVAAPTWPEATDPELRSAVLDVVRARASRDRAALGARAVLTSAPAVFVPRYSSGTILGITRLLARRAGRRTLRYVRRWTGGLASPADRRRAG